MLGDNVGADRDLLQGRSPTLDLDSVYGKGPDDPERRAVLYEADGLHLKMGKTITAGGFTGTQGGFDLLRGAGSTDDEKRKAIIADARNGETSPSRSVHCAMIRFHSPVVESARRLPPARRSFARLRENVSKRSSG